MYARALSGLQESFDEIALGYFFITQLAPEQRAWGAVALAFLNVATLLVAGRP